VTEPGPIGVFLVDDHALFRSGVRAELERAGSAAGGQPAVGVVGEAGSVQEAVAGIAHLRPDVVLLDIHMPDGGGAEALRQTRPDYPDMVFLALSVSDAAEDVIAVIRAGARGYAYKEIAAELFISVKTVETHVSSVLRKTQLSNRHELSRWASDRRLV
jgi:DNA-binding NarL/FixJ family response regulator